MLDRADPGDAHEDPGFQGLGADGGMIVMS